MALSALSKLSTGSSTGSQWGAGAKPGDGLVWHGQGPAPQMTQAQILKDMGIMSAYKGPQQSVRQSDGSMLTYGGGNVLGGVQPSQSPVNTATKVAGPQAAPQANKGSNLAAYWAANPGSLEQSMRDNPAAWGIAPGDAAAAPGGQTAGTSGFTTSSPTMATNTPKYGLSGAEDALQRGLAGGLSGISEGVGQAQQTLSPYTQGGSQAYNLQAALSGALGKDAQAQAFQNYQESPEQQYLRDRSEAAITRNAAATGGLGGGNVLKALQQNATGLAAQDYANSFNRLGTLSAMGHNSANLLGGIQANAGGQAGQMAYGTGGQMADYRTRAGEQIANNMANTSQGLAGMINQQGSDLSSIIGQGGSALSNLLAGYGSADSQTLQSLAALLANIGTGSASQVAGLPGLPGSQQTQGNLGGIGQLLGGLGYLIK